MFFSALFLLFFVDILFLMDTLLWKKNFLLFLLNFRSYHGPEFLQRSDAVEEINSLSFSSLFTDYKKKCHGHLNKNF